MSFLWQVEIKAWSNNKIVQTENPQSTNVSASVDDDRVKSDDEIFYESFDTNHGTGGNDGKLDVESGNPDFDNKDLSSTMFGFSAYQCISIGTSSYSGSYYLGPLDGLKSNYGCLTFRLMGANKSLSSCTVEVLRGNKTISKTDIPTVYSKWKKVILPFEISSSSVNFIIEGKRIFIDSVVVESFPKEISLSVGETGYSSLYYGNYALEVPSGVSAYTMKVDGNNIISSHKYSAGDIIPKSTGVIVKAPAKTYTFNVSYNDDGFVDKDNQLLGSDVKRLTSGGEVYYMLAKDEDNVGFYWAAENGGAFVSGAHRAYLALPSSVSSSAKDSYSFNFDDTSTSIAITITDKDLPIYNAMGQRVGKSYKGIVIKSGRKYIQR